MKNENHHVCPWWLGYIFLIPLRKLQHNPDTMFRPYIKEGMNILDYGCAMGYFSLPLAKMTGKSGNVYCVDIQEKMLAKLQKRALKTGVGEIIKLRLVEVNFDTLELKDKIDFTLLFAVAHEVPDQKKLFIDIYTITKAGGKVFFSEPKGHVKTAEFEKSLQLAQEAGFKISEEKPMRKGLCVLLVK